MFRFHTTSNRLSILADKWIFHVNLTQWLWTKMNGKFSVKVKYHHRTIFCRIVLILDAASSEQINIYTNWKPHLSSPLMQLSNFLRIKKKRKRLKVPHSVDLCSIWKQNLFDWHSAIFIFTLLSKFQRICSGCERYAMHFVILCIV